MLKTGTTRTERPVKHRLRTLFVLAVAAVCPLSVVFRILAGGVGGPLPRGKLLVLLTEYLVTLPLVGWLGWKYRGSAEGTASSNQCTGPGFLWVAVVYMVCTLPLAAWLGEGITQSDERAYLFQARSAAAGRLSVPVPPSIPNELLRYDHHVVLNGKLFGKYTQGWPAILALGSLAHLEWLVNPLLGLVLLWITYRISAGFAPPGQRAYGALLLAASPFLTLNCVGFMSQVAGGVMIACATLCYLRHEGSQRPVLWLSVMSVCLGGSVLVRPFTGTCAGAVLVAAALWKLGKRRKVPALAAFFGIGFLVLLCTLGILGAANHQLTGSYLRSPYAAYTNGGLLPGEVSFEIGGLLQNLTKGTVSRIADTALTAFPFVFLLAIYGLLRRRRTGQYILVAVFVALVIGYVVEFEDSGSVIGERFYFEAFFAIAILAGSGWTRLVEDCRWSAWFRRSLVSALCAIALAEMALGVNWEVKFRWPGRQMARAAERPPFARGMVYLAESPNFVPQHYNFNRPGSGLMYVFVPRGLAFQPNGSVPAQPSNGAEQNCAVLRYDEVRRDARWESCAAQPAGDSPFDRTSEGAGFPAPLNGN